MGIYNNHLSTVASSGPLWVSGQTYNPNDIVVYGSALYVCLAAHTAGATLEANISSWRLANQNTLTKNYMTTGSTAEVGTSGGWDTMSVSLSSLVPTGAPTIGSVASMALTTSSSVPLCGAYSWLLGNKASNNLTAGQGIISQVYTIDAVDQAKVLSIKFAYKAKTNPTDSTAMNFSGTSTNTFAVYIYDHTNSAWIQPAGVYNLVQSSGAGVCTGTFQTPSNMTQFRLAVVCINTTTAVTPAVNTYEMQFDDFYVGPQLTSITPAISDWQSYTPTATALISGSLSPIVTTGKYRRVGDSVQVQGTIRFTGPAAAFNGVNVTLPAGLSADVSKTTVAGQNLVGFATFLDAGVANYNAGNVYLNGPTAVSIIAAGINVFTGVAPVYAPGLTNTFPIAAGFSTNDEINFTFTVPVVGWSSNTISSADTDTRVVAASALTSGADQVIGAGATTKLTIYNDIRINTHGTFASNSFTAPVAGVYKVIGSCRIANAASANDKILQLYKNNAPERQVDIITSAGYWVLKGEVEIFLNAGDFVDWRVFNAQATSVTIYGSTTIGEFSVERLSGPAVVQATETVAASYCGTNGALIPNAVDAVTIQYSNKIFDTHNMAIAGVGYNSGTGAWTTAPGFLIPVSGKYQVDFSGVVDAPAGSLVSFVQVYQARSGSAISIIAGNRISSTAIAAGGNSSVGSTVLNCLAGDVIYIQIYQSSGASRNLITETRYSCVSIVRVGN